MDRQPVCFVISPIGEVESDVRSAADRVFRLLIEPALERYDFNVLRADQIVQVGEINRQVVELIQTAELCIVDLSDKNPNVYYECGRRHETSKPIIQIARDGESISFDLQGQRTIFYDLATPESVLNGQRLVQRFVEKMEETEFEPDSSAESLASVLESMRRIERKVDNLESQRTFHAPSLGAPDAANPMDVIGDMSTGGLLSGIAKRPSERFMEAILAGDAATADSSIPAVVAANQLEPAALLAAAGIIIRQGPFPNSTRIVLDHLRSVELSSADPEMFRSTFASAQALVDKEDTRQILPRILELVDQLEARTDVDGGVRGFCLNQVHMAFFTALGQEGSDETEEFSRCVEFAERAIDADPLVGSYHYNHSLVLEKCGRIAAAAEAAQRSLDCDDVDGRPDGDHLSQAIDVFFANGMYAELKVVAVRLGEVDPAKLRMKLALESQLREALQ